MNLVVFEKGTDAFSDGGRILELTLHGRAFRNHIFGLEEWGCDDGFACA